MTDSAQDRSVPLIEFPGTSAPDAGKRLAAFGQTPRYSSTKTSLSQRLIREIPYVAMLSMGLVGVGMVSFTGRSLSLYWLVLAPVYGAACVVAGWPRARSHERRIRLIWKQALHWLAFLLAMLLVTSSEVRGVENNNAEGLNLMTILASGTFVAGVHAEAWQIGVVGVALALAVPAIAWIEQSALLLVLFGVLAAFVAAAVFWAVKSRNA